MKKNKWFVLILALAFTQGASFAYAKDDAAKLQEELAAKKAELNGHEWEVKLTSGGKEAGTDTLVFTDMKFESKNQTAKGFNTTNYTISLQEGGPTVWETMQSDDKGAVVFWRGEWEKDFMKGMMSKQKDGKNEDFYFSSVGSKEIPKETPKKEEPKKEEVPAEATPAEVVDQAVDTAVDTVNTPAAEVQKQAEIAVNQAEAPKAAEAPKKKKWF